MQAFRWDRREHEQARDDVDTLTFCPSIRKADAVRQPRLQSGFGVGEVMHKSMDLCAVELGMMLPTKFRLAFN